LGKFEKEAWVIWGLGAARLGLIRRIFSKCLVFYWFVSVVGEFG